MSARFVPSSSTVYTPQTLANAMVRALGDGETSAWVDPCVGDGAFVVALTAFGVPKARIHALDLAKKRSEQDGLARTFRGIDFIGWASRRPNVCDRLVMNPPYVALSRLRGKPRAAALRVRVDDEGFLRLKANYWCAFVLSAISHALRPGGALAVVLLQPLGTTRDTRHECALQFSERLERLPLFAAQRPSSPVFSMGLSSSSPSNAAHSQQRCVELKSAMRQKPLGY